MKIDFRYQSINKKVVTSINIDFKIDYQIDLSIVIDYYRLLSENT